MRAAQKDSLSATPRTVVFIVDAVNPVERFRRDSREPLPDAICAIPAPLPSPQIGKALEWCVVCSIVDDAAFPRSHAVAALRCTALGGGKDLRGSLTRSLLWCLGDGCDNHMDGFRPSLDIGIGGGGGGGGGSRDSSFSERRAFRPVRLEGDGPGTVRLLTVLPTLYRHLCPCVGSCTFYSSLHRSVVFQGIAR
jgi:hypothetical protein